MRIQNDWVHYFMRFNLLSLNHNKCELVGRFAGELPAVTAADLHAHGISIEGNPIEPVAHDKAIRYLGVHCCFDGSWKPQHAKSLGMIHKFTSIVRKFEVSLSQARYMFNVFLMPKLELALHYVHGPGTQKFINTCNSIIIGCIKHAVASPLQLSHRAVARALGLILPSRLEVAVKVSELFLRINSTQSDCRWGQLGRLLMQQALPATVDALTPMPRSSNSSRLMRASAAGCPTRLDHALAARERPQSSVALVRHSSSVTASHRQHCWPPLEADAVVLLPASPVHNRA